jgi:ABC-type nitrate/sulfonate/bicarbonate transport system substrate-binding protein
MTCSRRATLRTLAGMGAGFAFGAPVIAHAAPMPLRVGLIDKTFYVLPLWIALHEGYAAREGLDVQLSYVAAGESAATGLLDGSIDVQLASADTVIQNVAKGGPLRIVAGNADKLSHSLIARPQFKRIEDLKGSTIGILTLTEGSFFNIQDMLEPHGLFFPRDYDVVPTAGAGARHKLLLDGKIDAGLQSIPWSYVAEDAGLTDLGEAIAVIPEYLFTVWTVNRLTMRADTMISFLRALRAGTARMYADRDLSVQILADELHMAPAYAGRGWDYFTSNAVFPKDLSFSRPGFAKVFETDKKARLLPPDAPSNAARYAVTPG